MLAGTVVSAVVGGLAGLTVALTRDHGVLLALFSYQLGGGLAVVGFLSLAQTAILRRN